MEEEMTGRIPARVAKLTAALLVSGAVAAVASGAASASSTVGGNPLPKSAGSNGVGPLTTKSTSTPYEAEYNDPIAGPIKCVGKHQTSEKKGYPGNETEGGRDKFKCTSTTGLPLTGVAPGETGVTLGLPGASGWDSDYFYFVKGGLVVAATSFTYKVSHKGTSFKAVAYY
jgi:hypothetical protein